MTYRALFAAVLVSVPTLAFAQGGAAAPSVEGVWKIAEVVTTGANASTNASFLVARAARRGEDAATSVTPPVLGSLA